LQERIEMYNDEFAAQILIHYISCTAV